MGLVLITCLMIQMAQINILLEFAKIGAIPTVEFF